ncbi:hypothetical protein EVA_10190 [gut metagenome]|uniref:Uncharacterized protein n=1 Tax=gut metagenome TaxID=749906 RepID=J9GP36_9ZZZZ
MILMQKMRGTNMYSVQPCIQKILQLIACLTTRKFVCKCLCPLRILVYSKTDVY